MRSLIVVFMTLSLTSTAWGWGAQGHKIVAQVAQNNLTPEATAAIAKILKNRSLADVANWADSIKGNPAWAHAAPWHYVTIPDGEDYSTAEHDHKGDVIVAITDMIKILKTARSTELEKENALKFIVHFVGDIHQPLHVGRPDDRGGNSTRVIFERTNTNLHSLWDSGLIAKTPMSYSEYADSLEPKSFEEASYDLPEISFSRIVRECMGARDAIYDFGSDEIPAVLSTQYYKKNQALMNKQLYMGGKRLADILNRLYPR